MDELYTVDMNKKRIFVLIFVIIGVFACISVCARWFIVRDSVDYIIATDELYNISDCQNVVILGSSVHGDGSMSGILRERAMTALDVYNTGKVCRILITGDCHVDNGYVYDEITPVQEFLIDAGVNSQIIIIDGDGFDTFQSMKNVRDVFGLQRIIIVTQDFHLARAIYIARRLGLDAQGYIAYKYSYQYKTEKLRNGIREFPAALKAIYETTFRK